MAWMTGLIRSLAILNLGPFLTRSPRETWLEAGEIGDRAKNRLQILP